IASLSCVHGSCSLVPYTTLFRSARPAAIISEGASWASVGAWTRGPSVICASGLAIATGTPSCSSTSCATPAVDAEQLGVPVAIRSEEHTSELQSRENLVCRLLLE